MKKFLLMILLGFGCYQSSMSPNWNEWFRQKKTQKKYLIQQFAGLQIYIGYARKGYRIVDNGLGFIGDVKHGTLNLHQGFFGSLKSINPTVANYARIGDILLLKLAILNNYRHVSQQIHNNKEFTTEQTDYVKTVLGRLLTTFGDL